MIEPFNSKFLTPTKKFRRLSVLLAVHNSHKISQHKMGRMIRLSSSMVNNYMKELQEEGLIRITGNTNRTQRYHLTSSGRDELISLLIAYSAEIIQLFGAAKREVAQRLNTLHSEKIRSIALFGAAETAEVVHAAIKETPLTVKGIVDSDPSKQGKPFNGLTIKAPDHLKKMNVDAVVITSYAKQKEIHECIRQLAGENIKVKNLSDL
jgi:DNA-binding MarR family transcriptional regulator